MYSETNNINSKVSAADKAMDNLPTVPSSKTLFQKYDQLNTMILFVIMYQ